MSTFVHKLCNAKTANTILVSRYHKILQPSNIRHPSPRRPCRLLTRLHHLSISPSPLERLSRQHSLRNHLPSLHFRNPICSLRDIWSTPIHRSDILYFGSRDRSRLHNLVEFLQRTTCVAEVICDDDTHYHMCYEEEDAGAEEEVCRSRGFGLLVDRLWVGHRCCCAMVGRLRVGC